MPDFVKNNTFSFLVLVLLLSLIYLQWTNKQRLQTQQSIQVVKRDTVWMDIKNYTSIVPKLVERIPYRVTDSQIMYIPDTNYARLVQQYHDLVEELLAKHIYVDTLKIDTIGYVQVSDTITNNRVLGRSYLSYLSYPTITKTIYQTEPPKSMLYWGLGLQMRDLSTVGSLSTGALYKFRNDLMIGGNIGLDQYGKTLFGIHGYWPLTLKK